MKYKDSNNEWQELVVKASDTLPIGFIGISPSETIPYGWLLCDGSEVSRTSYADLFKVIGTTYGNGDGSTTFNLPNLKGRIPVGLDASQTEFDTLGETGGSKELQKHSHNITGIASDGTTRGVAEWKKNVSGTSDGLYTYVHAYTNDTGTGESGNLPPYIVQNYIIKAKQSTAVVAQAVNEYTTGNDKVYDVDYINSKGKNKLITITRKTSASDESVSYTGVGFKPKKITVFAVANGDVYNSNGFADETKLQRCFYQWSTNAYNTSAYLCVISNYSQWAVNGSLLSYDEDGFTISWSKIGNPSIQEITLYVLCEN